LLTIKECKKRSKSDTGKSYLAQALANKAIVDGYRVYYIRTPSLLEEIKIARLDGTISTIIQLPMPF